MEIASNWSGMGKPDVQVFPKQIVERKKKRLKLNVGIFNWDQEYPSPKDFLCNTSIFRRMFIQFRIATQLGDKGLQEILYDLDAMTNISVLNTNHFCSKFFTKWDIKIYLILPLVPVNGYFSFIQMWGVGLEMQLKMHN